MIMQEVEQDRKEFEASVFRACADRGYNTSQILARYDDGMYRQMWVDSAWIVWQHKQPELSDLEIVQKALEKSGSMIRIYPDGSATIVSADKNNRAVFSELADVLQALTWAKQTIEGVE